MNRLAVIGVLLALVLLFWLLPAQEAHSPQDSSACLANVAEFRGEAPPVPAGVWQNPMLRVGIVHFEVHAAGMVQVARTPQQALQHLCDLPDKDWPWGRVVGIAPATRGENINNQHAAERTEELVLLLRRHGVRSIVWTQ